VRLKTRKKKKKARFLETKFCANIPREEDDGVSKILDKYYSKVEKLTRAHIRMFFIRLPTAKAKRRSLHSQAEAKSK
jgi:hypothetical protein